MSGTSTTGSPSPDPPPPDPLARADDILGALGGGPSGNGGPRGRDVRPAARGDETTAARSKWRTLSWWTPGIVLAVAFVVSRVVSRMWGVRYDATLLHHAWQLLDPELLDDHLWESVWYLHMQPPLFNLFVGGLLDLSPFTDATTLEAAWIAMGAGVTALVYDLLRQLGTGRPWALVATIVICCGPGVVFYEAWFAYEMPVMLLLTATVDAVARWQRHGHVRALAAACGCAAAAVLTRSMLHPVWMVAVVAVVLLATPRRHGADRAAERSPAARRAGVVLAAGLPLLLVGGVIVKNQVLFDRTDMSSWMGWNLHRVAFGDMDEADKQALVDEGVVSPLVMNFMNQPYSHYEAELGPCEPSRPDVPALAEQSKNPDPVDPTIAIENNLNYECYLRVYDRYQEDSLAAIRARPGEYLRAVASGAQVWALPSTDYSFVRLPRDAVQPFETWYRHLVYLDVPVDPPVLTDFIESQLGCIPLPDGEEVCWIPGGGYRFSLTIVAGTLAAGLMAVRGAWRWARRGDRTQAVWVVNGLTIGWVTAASILLELGENNRFRTVVEPLTLVTVAWLLGRGAHALWVRSPWGAPTRPDASAEPDRATTLELPVSPT